MQQQLRGPSIRAPALKGAAAPRPAGLLRPAPCTPRRAPFTSPSSPFSPAPPARGPAPARVMDMFNDPITARPPKNPDPSLINEDFSPTTQDKRTFDTLDYATFWITLVISITTYYLAASLVDLGMSWWQGILTVFFGNLITLLPMVLNAHPGTKYGVPFPVLARASFGIQGANLPSLSRAIVACGWFGIQTWIGGSSIFQMLMAVTGGAVAAAPIAWLGISLPELLCFLAFWAAQVWIVVRGMESIRILEKYSAPILIGLSLALMGWAVSSAGGFGPMLSTPSQFGVGMPKEGQFWQVFWPAVTANVGYWATLSLNIPDFTRYAKSQKDQVMGQAIGLPLFMALFTFLGLAVTSATVVIYGEAIIDPVQLLGRMEGLVPICISLFGLMWATLTTNIAANVVAPANAFVNCAPKLISFEAGGILTAVLGLLMCPWNLVSSTHGFVNTWLIGYSALLGPVIGIVMSDYFIVRRRQLDIDSLYSKGEKSIYWYKGGWNTAALWAILIGVMPTLPGFLGTIGVVSGLPPIFGQLYDLAWFVGVAVSSVVYCLLMRGAPGAYKSGGDAASNGFSDGGSAPGGATI
ncbi:hypothetical protein HXX76_006013 [Chlamydomonas incerta]|uniref:Uncharacterized protein n=1 Tax=Chlamydomonas incerta TaxID=51695 RepID=A0A835T6Y7_CHLIN|nr:hypothetical protein HXX76_006013 [Chlamydomonas incerta]|eukprot:KAG2437358.1 hypothetical protein HXX76_006013 [Chlamydomonas incerta]